MTANTPQKPHTEGMEWTNAETGIKYMFTNGGWRAVSSEASEEVADAISKLDLETVLTNGNIADHGIELTDGTDDLIVVSPEEALVGIASDLEAKKPRFRLAHIDKLGYPDSHAQWEIDDNGTRNDIDLGGNIEALHVRFDDQETFTLDKTGDAAFSGKVQVEPGTQGNEAVTYSQLVEIEEELESIVPSIERGQFEILLTDLQAGDEGKFNMLRRFSQADASERLAECQAEKDACIRNPNIDEIDCEADYERCERRIPEVGTGYYPTDEFADVIRLKFSLVDVDGVQHSWQDLKAGMMVDVFNLEDDSYMLAEITGTSGMWYEGVDIDVKVLQFKGKTTGRCRIKIFELDLNAGSDVDFVRKQGTNKVESGWKIESANRSHFHVDGNETRIYWLRDPAHEQQPVTLGYADNNYASKQDIEELIKSLNSPARLSWMFSSGHTTPQSGQMACLTNNPQSGDVIYLHYETLNGTIFSKRINTVFYWWSTGSGHYKPIITIWDYASSGYRHKHSRSVQKVEMDARGIFKITLSSEVGGTNHNLTENAPVWITLDGFF
jgi:hypothetical protein